MKLSDIESWGVVGAGGAGFPAHVKLSSPAVTFILNAAECEPLLHKDKEILRNETDAVMAGLEACIELTSSVEAIVAVKQKYPDLISRLSQSLPSRAKLVPIPDFYPAGDEITLVQLVTGRTLQPGRLPLSEGCVVQNVETVLNIGKGVPVTEKYLTVSGAVTEPATVKVPVGTPLSDVLAKFEITSRNYVAFLNGLMMGSPETDLSKPVTKRTTGIVVLPADHPRVRIAERYRTVRDTVRIAKAGCDQCSFCTELCPRYLLGQPVRPETAMRNRLFGTGDSFHNGNLFCCECGLCTLYACPEDLDPKGATVMEKIRTRAQKSVWEGLPVKPHPMADYRRTPVKKLMQRLGVSGYRNDAPLKDYSIAPSKTVLDLRQHAGVPAVAIVEAGTSVRKGDLVAKAGGKISANIHASIDGRVTGVTPETIIIERGP